MVDYSAVCVCVSPTLCLPSPLGVLLSVHQHASANPPGRIRSDPSHPATKRQDVPRRGVRVSVGGQQGKLPPHESAQSSGRRPRPFLARCLRLRRSPRVTFVTISWSVSPSTRGRKSDALSVLRVLKPRRGRPLPLMETYHWRLALARRLLPLPSGSGSSVEWWHDA